MSKIMGITSKIIAIIFLTISGFIFLLLLIQYDYFMLMVALFLLFLGGMFLLLSSQISKTIPTEEALVQEFKSEEPAKKLYSLEGIAIASSLTQKGYETILKKIPEIEEEMDQNDPCNLSENVSDERYDKVSEKYEWLSERLTRNEDAAAIFRKIGPKKGGHDLDVFDTPIEIEFNYSKNNEDSGQRKAMANKYTYADFKLYLNAVEIDSDIEKTFLLNNISNVTTGETPIENIFDYLRTITNNKIENILSMQE